MITTEYHFLFLYDNLTTVSTIDTEYNWTQNGILVIEDPGCIMDRN